MVRVWPQEGSHGRVVVPEEKLRRLPLVALPPSQEAAVVEHILRHGVQRPIIPLPGIPRFPGDLDETIVQGEIMPYRILPRGKLFPVVRESRHDKLTNATQSQFLVRRLEDRHRDQRYVRVGRLDEVRGRLLVRVLHWGVFYPRLVLGSVVPLEVHVSSVSVLRVVRVHVDIGVRLLGRTGARGCRRGRAQVTPKVQGTLEIRSGRHVVAQEQAGVVHIYTHGIRLGSDGRLTERFSGSGLDPGGGRRGGPS